MPVVWGRLCYVSSLTGLEVPCYFTHVRLADRTKLQQVIQQEAESDVWVGTAAAKH